MRAGALKYRLQILRPVYVRDRMGAQTASRYDESATVWAERVNLTGNRSEEVGEHFPDYDVKYNIRDAHEVKENWQVRELGGNLYTVTAIIPNKDRGFNQLICERVNE